MHQNDDLGDVAEAILKRIKAALKGTGVILGGTFRFSGYYALIAGFGVPWVIDIARGSQQPWPGKEQSHVYNAVCRVLHVDISGQNLVILLTFFPAAIFLDVCLRATSPSSKTIRQGAFKWAIRGVAMFLWLRLLEYVIGGILLIAFLSSIK
jgi:hypothetical protein